MNSRAKDCSMIDGKGNREHLSKELLNCKSQHGIRNARFIGVGDEIIGINFICSSNEKLTCSILSHTFNLSFPIFLITTLLLDFIHFYNFKYLHEMFNKVFFLV